MGTPKFALPCLEALAASKHTLAGVVSAFPKPAGRGLQSRPSAVETRGRELGLEVKIPGGLKAPEFLNWLSSKKADVGVVVAFRYLPKEVYALPRLGTINLHASLLPRYRGAAPINWAIYNGETKTGVTTFLLDEHIDTGAILAQKECPIDPDETAGELSEKLSRNGSELVLETLDGLESGKLRPSPQPKDGGSGAPKLKKENLFILWEHPAFQVYNQIRAFSPAPAAWGKLGGGETVKIYKSRILDASANGTPGSWHFFDDKSGLAVNCGEGAVELLELSLEGRKKITGAEFARGQKRLAEKRFELSL
jgi:methionyl-tRNA formyltransferase